MSTKRRPNQRDSDGGGGEVKRVRAPLASRTAIRFIYAWEDEEDPEWQEALGAFENKVPRFDSKEEALEFSKKFCSLGSSHEFRHFQHVMSTLVTWDQVEKLLIKKMVEYNKKYPFQAYQPLEDPSRNRFLQESDVPGVADIVKALEDRMAIPFHYAMSTVSTINTLKYLFFHMRCGIYVMIRRRKVVMFVPFANDRYMNTWSKLLKFDSPDGDMKTYYELKRENYRKEQILLRMEDWWANGNVICNEKVRPGQDSRLDQVWGDHFHLQLRDMLEEACRAREVADCEFFINKRDYPHLKVNLEKGKAVEPYGFIFDKDDRKPEEDVDLVRHCYTNYTPITSFYMSDRFADLPMPTSEDWDAATGKVFPATFQHKLIDGQIRFEGEPRDLYTEDNFKKFYCKWEDKQATAFFRGTCSGGGTKVDTNQRLKLAQLSHLWSKDPFYNGTEEGTPPLLDAALTGWNMRDKKIASESTMTFVRKKDFEFQVGLENFVPIYQQSKYKYLIYIEGHCAACRYSFLMRLGSVILKVDSRCVADRMWYFPLLRPWEDHVPVKEDLSDLDEKILWCRENDEKCREIAANAASLYEKFCAKEGILDYLELMTHKIAEHWRATPEWWEPPKLSLRKPQAERDHVKDCTCTRCLEEKAKDRLREEEEARERELRKERLARQAEAEFGRSRRDDRRGGRGGREEEDVEEEEEVVEEDEGFMRT